MSTIVNAQWKSKKVGDIVTFKGEDYEIGSDAFGSLEAAVEAGETSDLVIVDKKLASPVKKVNITGAATDIFASTYTEKDTADGKTHTETVKFTGAAGGTASFKDDDATLVGFEKITATEAGGSFAGGKQDISSSLKTVDDSDKNIKTEDMTATATTTATGSLSVTGKTGTPSVETSAIVDSEGNTDKSIAIIKDAYKEITGADREEPLAGTYAAVTLKNANLTADINGGVISEKAVIKTSDTNSEKINKEYTYSASAKVGSGEASLTDANAADISGFKSVKITTSANAVKVGEINAGNETADYSKKSAYVADKSFTYNYSEKETDTVSGSLTATGKSGKEIEIDGDIDGFSSVSLKYATVNDDVESFAASGKNTTDVSVKDQKGDAAITATFTTETARTADGSLTAADSTLGNLVGVKTVAISNSTIGAFAVATNLKAKTTDKTTGIANAGITDNIDDYITGWTVDADWDKAYTTDSTAKTENSVGGASFKVSGKAPAAYAINVNGYKTVALENGGGNILTANLFNDSSVTDSQFKRTFAPESSASYTEKRTGTDKAVGDVTAKGMTTIGGVDGFASVKVTGTVDQTVLTGVTGQNTESRTISISSTIKAGKEDPEGTYTETTSASAKAATALEASKTEFGASFTDLKTAKLQNIKSGGAVSFAGAVDSDNKTSRKFTWTADDITVLKAENAGTTKSIVDTDVTSWTETSDEKQSASGTFALKNGSETISLSANRFKSVEISGGANTTLTGAIGQDTYTDKESKSLSVSKGKGTYSSSDAESAKAATELTVTKAKLGGVFTNLKTVSLKDVSGAGAASFIATADYDDKKSKKFEWNAEEKAYKDVIVAGINDEAITSWTETDDYKVSASGTFALKNGATAGAISVGAYNFKSIDVAGAIATTTLTAADGQDTYTDKWSKSLSVSKGKGTYSESETESAKAVTDLTVTKVTLGGTFTDLKTVKLTDVAGAGAFTASYDYDDKESQKYEWNAEEKAYKDHTHTIFDETNTSWTETNDEKQSASGTFSLKGGSSAVTVSADYFKSVEVAGGSGVLTLDGVTGLDTETYKDSESLSVKGGKGTYSWSYTDSTKAATDLTASKVTLADDGADLKTVKLTDAAGIGDFTATIDYDDKYSKKFDWNAEEKAYKDVIVAGIYDEAITSWTESQDYKESASGTFSLKNGASIDGSVGAEYFKSVEVTGAIDHTILTGVLGQDTYTKKESESLSVSKGKGTYSETYEDSYKAATELSASKVTLSGGAFSSLKSATLKDAKIAGVASFTASLDDNSKSSKKISWNAEDATFADVEYTPFDESVTSWEETSESKSSVVGTFSLTNSNAAAQINALSIDNFKNAELSIAVQTTPVTVVSFANQGDRTFKDSLKRSVSETKRTQDVSSTVTSTAVGTLKITGNKTAPTQLVINDAPPAIGYANITLKDAWISNPAAYATAYAETQNYSAKESATLDSGSPTVVDLKVTRTDSKKGNGSFTASGSSAFTAFDGDLYGYSTISLKDKVSIGDVDNYKYDGTAGAYWVPANGGEYFDVIAANYTGTEPGTKEVLTGNISGSYKLDAKGQVESKWTASSATTANGSFTQTATVANVTAGDIFGYDKVTLTGVKTAGDIDGTNTANSTVLDYKYAKDEVAADSKVVTATTSSASSVTLTGKEFDKTMQQVTAASITGYKTVTLKDALVSGSVSAINSSWVRTEDKLNSPDTNVEVITDNAVGSLSAVSSELQSNVFGFTTVDLKNTVAGGGVSFAGGNRLTVNTYDAGWNFVAKIEDIKTSTGSFSAVSDEKSADPKLAKVQSVGNVTGFAKVELKNYNAGFINANASSEEFIAADDETPDTWKRESATSGNTFAASADSYVDGTTIKQNAITVGDVYGYGKVEATGLQEIGAIMNAVTADDVVFGGRVYSSMHYGEYTAVAEEGPLSYTAIISTAGTGVTVKGVSSKVAAPAPTDVLGDVVGYKAIALDTVNLGDGTGPVRFAGGNYTYTTKKSSDDAVVATSTSTADGKLEIKNATFVAGTTFSAEGFKTVDVNIAGTAAFADIIGGTETAQFTDGSFDFATFKCGDKAVVTTEEGIVTGTVAGYATVTLTDTNFAAGAEIIGFELGTKKVDDTIEQTYTAKTAVTFDDADEGKAAQTIAGTITNAKSVTFKASTADDETDFDITAAIQSAYDDKLISDDLTVTFDKCQATVDFSNFALDDGDEIKLTSGTATAQITLGGDYSDLAAYFAGMAGSGFTGTGEIISTADEKDIRDALAANEISCGTGITFTKA